jgi:hypothetical protein
MCSGENGDDGQATGVAGLQFQGAYFQPTDIAARTFEMRRAAAATLVSELLAPAERARPLLGMNRSQSIMIAGTDAGESRSRAKFESPENKRERRALVRRAAAALASLLFIAGFGLYFSWKSDNDLLRSRAVEITSTLSTDAERILAISTWVHHTGGFERNRRFFLWPQLGPTPIQVLESGGNCADRSRLVSAMLSELGIRAGIVMIFRCQDCAPIHSVVEAVYEYGRMVVDPVWNVYYPGNDGRFLGVADLAGTDLGKRHLLWLQQEHAPHENATDRMSAMSEAEATFDVARSINWEKNWATNAAAATLEAFGIAPDNIIRPRVLEDPKLMLCVLMLAGAIGFLLMSICAGSTRRTR